MRAGVVINPISGRAGRVHDAGPRRAALARDVAARLRVNADVRITERAGHAAELTKLFIEAGCARVVVWGGDGTVNEVAGPIVARGTSVTLGIVPGGSGDGLARSLGLAHPPELALETALTAAPVPIDVGFLDDRHFLNIAGVGFDAAVGRAFNARGKRGLRNYVRILLTLVWTYSPERYRLTMDGLESEGDRFLVAFANGREYGNQMVLAPAASVRDGWLDVVTVGAGSPVVQLWRARRLAIRPGKPAAGVSWGRCQTARISGQNLVCHVDGEAFETSGTVEVRIARGALNVAGVV